jgi:SAM-dependent methyltransferase
MPFDAYASYYDLLYHDKDYPGEANYIAALIHRFSPAATSLLELGSGSGIHASLLAAKGFSVHGVEISEGMFAKAHELRSSSPHAAQLEFSRGDVRTVKIGKTFDAALSLFHVVSYQTSNEDVAAEFATAREHLPVGGLFIFDVWYGPAVLVDRPVVRIKRIENDAIGITRLAEPDIHPERNIVDVNYTVMVMDKSTRETQEIREKHPMRYFFSPEIELFARLAGFEILHSEEWMTGCAPGFDTWGVVFVLRANTRGASNSSL